MFEKRIDWDTLKKEDIRHGRLLRDLTTYGIGKKQWIYISLRLNYHVYDSIKNAPKIPKFLFRCDVNDH